MPVTADLLFSWIAYYQLFIISFWLVGLCNFIPPFNSCHAANIVTNPPSSPRLTVCYGLYVVSGLWKNYLVYLKKELSFLFAQIFGVILHLRGMLVNSSISVIPQCNKYFLSLHLRKSMWIQEEKCFYAVNHNYSISWKARWGNWMDVCKMTLKNIDYWIWCHSHVSSLQVSRMIERVLLKL